MANLAIQSPAEQVAEHLQKEIRRGVWRDEMPGAPSLARDLMVDPKTVLAALGLLENEGLLIAQGVGRRRLIDKAKASASSKAPPLRIGILLNEKSDVSLNYLGDLQHGLAMAGHHTFFGHRTQSDLGMDLNRIRKFVEREAADAWVVISGSRAMLQWFADWSVPCFALFGRFGGLQIAAALPEKIPAYQRLVDELVALGHRRISLLVREDRRLPEPGRTERAFLERLEHHGIMTNSYHLPNWQDGKGNFLRMLENQFAITPPTALVVQEAFVLNAVYHFLSSRGLRVPHDVSIACSDDDSTFVWCDPPVTCIRWDSAPIIRRVVNWAAKLSRGQRDVRQLLSKAELIVGGTIGAARGTKGRQTIENRN